MSTGIDPGALTTAATRLDAEAETLQGISGRAISDIRASGGWETQPVSRLAGIATSLQEHARTIRMRATNFNPATQWAYTSWTYGEWGDEPPPLAATIEGLEAEIARVQETGDFSQENLDYLKELQIALALLTLDETEAERIGLETEMESLESLPLSMQWATDRRTEIEVRLVEIALEQLAAEEALLFLTSEYESRHTWEHQERYEEIQIHKAYLEWQLSLLARPDMDFGAVLTATRTIRNLLDEDANGDVTKERLEAIEEQLSGLHSTEMDAVIAGLPDEALDRWMAELDGGDGGNYNDEEEARLFAMLAQNTSAISLWRIMWADGGDKADPISEKLWGYGTVEQHMSFIELTAGRLEEQPAALPMALILMADMDDAHVTATMAEVAANGHLDALVAATEEFAESLEPKKSRFGPIGDFVGGAWDSLWGSVTGIWGLTFQGVYDFNGWKENWGGVGSSFGLLFSDPVEFLSVIIDVETLTENPARWLGGLVPDVAAAVFTGGTVTAAAKGGRLGARLSTITTRLRTTTMRISVNVSELLSDPRLQAVMRRLTDERGSINLGGGATWRMADLDGDDLLDAIAERGLPDDIFEQFNGHLHTRHIGWSDDELLERVVTSQNTPRPISQASSFTDDATARSVTQAVLTNSDDEIRRWLESANPGATEAFPYVGDDVIGRSVSMAGAWDVTDAVIVLKKLEDGGFYVLTGYPK